jgi:hypothetical protein
MGMMPVREHVGESSLERGLHADCTLRGAQMKTLHKRCAGLDVHKTEVVACLRVANRGKASYEVRRYPTTTRAH